MRERTLRTKVARDALASDGYIPRRRWLKSYVLELLPLSLSLWIFFPRLNFLFAAAMQLHAARLAE